MTNDVSACNQSGTHPRDREGWRAGVKRCRSTLNTKTGYDDDDDLTM